MRNKRKEIRLTQSELEYIESQIAKTNGELNFTQYMVKSALEQKIEIIPAISKEALLVIRRSGSNLNQIATHLNDKKEIYPASIFKKNQEMIIKLLKELIQVIKDDRQA